LIEPFPYNPPRDPQDWLRSKKSQSRAAPCRPASGPCRWC